MSRSSTLYSALILSTLAGAANAATLDNVSGDVLVNTGSGFVQISGPVTLKEGDTIMANAGGSAVLTCDSGAVINIQPGQVTTVCDVTPGPPPSPDTIPNGLIIGGIAVAAGTAIIIGTSDSGGDKPVSGQ
ncbi:MAG: hypothetical protein KDJ17_04300 [Hyphomicrobiaceae bacterium]|nr:hypothetical protein [Hyphomicrobiaceae bacterium]